MDSRSFSHIVNSKEMPNNVEKNVTVANGKKLISHGSGNVNRTEKDNRQTTLRDVLFAPEIETNLLLVTKNRSQVKFEKYTCDNIHRGEIILQGRFRSNLYAVNIDKDEDDNHYANNTYNCTSANCIDLWYRWQRHGNYEAKQTILSKQLVNGSRINNCKHTPYVRMHKIQNLRRHIF